MTKIKICGITNAHDAEVCVQCGADAIGFVFADSPRRATVEQVREIIAGSPPFVTTVGVFADAPVGEVKRTLDTTGCAVAQLHGSESPEYLEALSPCRIIKAIRVGERLEVTQLSGYRGAEAILLDTYVAGRTGGTGRRFDPMIAAGLVQQGWRVILAGGLTPENVGEAVTAVRPYAVDVSSGVELSPGHKDPEKIARFISAVRAADSEGVAHGR